jgi:nitroimidazol reductase NimA-like FMN-containing flavoprotein (pyridoxamine 5'-phosphate oxidase superfamily)
MSTWDEVEQAVPALARTVRERFEKYTLGVLATLRRDGSPRVTGIEPGFSDGELWLGMMSDSRKGADLRRDPRFALHAATIDKDVKEPDARVAGLAQPVEDERKERFADDLEREKNWRPQSFDLFRVDVRELGLVFPEDGKLVIESWHPGRGITRVARD